MGEIDGARGDNPCWFYVLSSTVSTTIRGIGLLGGPCARCASLVVLFRVFERIGRRRRLQPRHGDLQETQDDDDDGGGAWSSSDDGDAPSISGPSFDKFDGPQVKLLLDSTTTVCCWLASVDTSYPLVYYLYPYPQAPNHPEAIICDVPLVSPVTCEHIRRISRDSRPHGALSCTESNSSRTPRSSIPTTDAHFDLFDWARWT